jgi:hypothetical protein
MSARAFLDSREARTIVGMWAAWSVGILLLASAAQRLPGASQSPWAGVPDPPPLARWDSGWYRSVAVEGYHYSGERESNVGFYPLYPLLVRGLSSLAHAPLLPTGIVLSLVCLGGALLLIGDLFVEWGGRGMGAAGAAVLLCYPTAFFLAAFYTESLFLLLAAAALWGARRERWAVSGAAALAVGLTRFNGFLLVPAVVAYAVPSLRIPGKPRWPPILAVTAALAGAVLYPLYLWRRFGDPFLYVHNKIAGWSVRPRPVWTLATSTLHEVLAQIREPTDPARVALEVGSTALFLVLTAALFVERRVPEGIYAAATLLLLLTSGTLAGIQRYVLVLFPCFFPLARLLRPRPALAFAYGVVGIGGGVVLLHRFVHWLFVG